MSGRTLAVVSAGLGEPSSTRLLAGQLGAATGRALRRRGLDLDLHQIEVREHAHDVLNAVLTGFPSTELKGALDEVTHADGLIAVTPVFNASYSGLFKSFFDVLEQDSLLGKPVLIAATGGTARHSLALDHAMRPLFSYLRALVVPTAVFAAAEDWGGGGAAHGSLVSRVERAADELADQVARRESTAPVDPFDDPTPFAQLLAGD